ncbi:hypothetical protein EYF80_044955 [Liparis tanakae]|uniref:Uncharacterized protein n=1 Tax=Liparis tanakae TaxID=230148 RepID=A0A4Z2FU93_9TELE|nr:hypothetical protein EYF80_044955 [Liparis tanakae]
MEEKLKVPRAVMSSESCESCKQQSQALTDVLCVNHTSPPTVFLQSVLNEESFLNEEHLYNNAERLAHRHGPHNTSVSSPKSLRRAKRSNTDDMGKVGSKRADAAPALVWLGSVPTANLIRHRATTYPSSLIVHRATHFHIPAISCVGSSALAQAGSVHADCDGQHEFPPTKTLM